MEHLAGSTLAGASSVSTASSMPTGLVVSDVCAVKRRDGGDQLRGGQEQRAAFKCPAASAAM